MSVQAKTPLLEYLLRLGDDSLVLGHRLSEWCGHGPYLEEDIALSNIALDCTGQATHLLALAGEVEGAGQNENDLAYKRHEYELRNVLLVEQPNGDFAQTIMRQLFYSAYAFALHQKLSSCRHEQLAGISGKTLKEVAYHLRHSREWVLRLGDGTDESQKRAQAALDTLWTFTGELFHTDDVDEALESEIGAPKPSSLETEWRELVEGTLKEATLTLPPADTHMRTGGRAGKHTEHLGHLLAEMQIVPRSFPGAEW